MNRFYIMPLARVDLDGTTYRAPKYLHSNVVPEGIPCPWSAKDYGLIDACLVAADVADLQHAQLVAYPDVAAVPANIDRQIGNALPQVQATLEALRIPSGGITTQHTFRQVLRIICGLFELSQVHHALHDEALVDNAQQLNLTWGEIPIARRQRLVATAATLHYHTAGIKANWTIRQILKHLADQQWANAPIHFGRVTL